MIKKWSQYVCMYGDNNAHCNVILNGKGKKLCRHGL